MCANTLVPNYGFDDSQLKTLGMGKQADANADAAWGTVKIIIYTSQGPEIPPGQATSGGYLLESNLDFA